MKIDSCQLYVLIDSKKRGISYKTLTEKVIRGGADLIQLRVKDLTDRERLTLGKGVLGITRKHGIPLVINDSLDIALIIGADGVHLGQDDISIKDARRLSVTAGRREFIIGKSTHSLKQAMDAQREGADYIGVGPIFPSKVKPDYTVVGAGLIKQVEEKIRVPFFAIGGINQNNIENVLKAGARRVAVSGAVCEAEDVQKATRRLKEKLKSTRSY